jgi:pyruvate dehydrogenase E2 component (dihydrolipoamide acetyltransferase)
MEEGLIGKWHKQEGDTVKQNELLCEVETEKATDELTAPVSGTLLKIVYAEGTTALVNSVIAVIGSPGEDISSVLESNAPRTVAAVRPQAEPTKPTQIPEQPKPLTEAPPISPSARRLAREKGVDLRRIKGTGPGGRIVSEDVIKAASEPAAARASQETISLTGHRKVIADRLSLSARTAVHVPITMEVDMTGATHLKEELQRAGTSISFTDLIIKAVAMALTEFPRTNSMLLGDELKVMNQVNVGLAVGTEDDLLVPVIKNANQLTVPEIAAETKTLIERARNHTLTMKEMSQGTFTVSNLGMFGDVNFFAPIINPPETAILGVGRAIPKPVAIDGAIVVRPIITMTLVFDHRVIDGMYAANFLQRVKTYIESPQSLTTK